jgi:hypothetical protein
VTFDPHKNFAYSTVATPPSPASSGTSLVVAAGEGSRFPAPSFNAVVWPAGLNPLPTNAEVVRVSAGPPGSDTFTIARAQEGSSARAIVAGDQIADAITAKDLTDIEARLLGPAATVAGLGTPVDGSIGTLAAGASPYELVTLTYNASLAKWVSPFALGPVGITSGFTSTSTSYVAVSDASVRRAHIPNFKDLYDAGLRLQLWAECDFHNSAGGNTSFIAVAMFEYSSGDPTVTQVGSTVGAEITVVGTTHTYRSSGWVDFNPAAPAKQNIVLISEVKVSAGTGTYGAPNVFYRLVG